MFVWFTIANNNKIKNASKVILIKNWPHNTNIVHNKKYIIRPKYIRTTFGNNSLKYIYNKPFQLNNKF